MVIPEDPPEVNLGYEPPRFKKLKTKYQVFDAAGDMVREGRMVLLDPENLHGAPVEMVWSEWYDPEKSSYVESYVYTPHPRIWLAQGERVVFS